MNADERPRFKMKNIENKFDNGEHVIDERPRFKMKKFDNGEHDLRMADQRTLSPKMIPVYKMENDLEHRQKMEIYELKQQNQALLSQIQRMKLTKHDQKKR